MAVEVARVVDVVLKLVLVESLEVVVLEELEGAAVLEHLHGRDEHFALEFAGERRTHAHDYLHVVAVVGVAGF